MESTRVSHDFYMYNLRIYDINLYYLDASNKQIVTNRCVAAFDIISSDVTFGCIQTDDSIHGSGPPKKELVN